MYVNIFVFLRAQRINVEVIDTIFLYLYVPLTFLRRTKNSDYTVKNHFYDPNVDFNCFVDLKRILDAVDSVRSGPAKSGITGLNRIPTW